VKISLVGQLGIGLGLALLAAGVVTVPVRAADSVAEVAQQDALLGQAVRAGNVPGMVGLISPLFRSPLLANKTAWVAYIGHWHTAYRVVQAVESSRQLLRLRNGRVAVVSTYGGVAAVRATGATFQYCGSSWTEWAKSRTGWQIVYVGIPALGSPAGRH
jgi:hypothetical protein